MKRLFVIAMMAAMVCSCAKEGMESIGFESRECTVYISLKNEDGTKASGTGHGIQADDNNINTLEIFIFRVNDGQADDGMLDGYRKFTGSELTSLDDLEVKTTTGKKMIYAVANSHKESWAGIVTRSAFEAETARLSNDDLKNFIMVGSAEEVLQLASRISVSIKRLVARVQVNSVTAAFDGTPYAGCSLQNVKGYLINVQGMKYISNGSGDNLKVLNSKKYVEADVSACTMQGMLYEDIATSIGASVYNTPHYFYCYENNRTEETETDRFTRLVIEAQLNGTTYYYPIAIKELQGNCCYSIDVKIQRPGSLDPDKDLESGIMELEIEVLGWNSLPGSVVEF